MLCCSEVSVPRSLLHLLQAANARFAIHPSDHSLLKGKTALPSAVDEVSTRCLIAVRTYSMGSATV